MEKFRASVENSDDKHVIKIRARGDEEILIPLSEDKPNEVKSAFNKILSQLKHGELQIEIEDVGDDLFSQVAKEYIIQLNREVLEVYGEMQQHGLVCAS